MYRRIWIRFHAQHFGLGRGYLFQADQQGFFEQSIARQTADRRRLQYRWMVGIQHGVHLHNASRGVIVGLTDDAVLRHPIATFQCVACAKALWRGQGFELARALIEHMVILVTLAVALGLIDNPDNLVRLGKAF